MKQVLTVILLVSGFLSSSAQSKRIVADKIVAQVGDKIILSSDVTNALSDIKRQAQGQDNVVIPSECQILEGQLIQKALVLQAQKDSLSVSEDEIENEMESHP
jgi:peptidyl-prolyl cis-trans isomerase SurA